MPATENPIHLTVHLARNGVRAEELLNRTAATSIHGLKLPGNPAVDATLLVKTSEPKPPDWSNFFAAYLDPNVLGENSSSSAALLINVDGKYFALTFGSGRFLLETDNFEDGFGLKVALNCIGEGTVRSIDKHSLDHLLRHTREQASRDARTSEFGFDVEQDLLKAVTGKPKDKRYGERITGADSLQIAVPVTIDQLPELLERLGNLFLDTAYRENFPWVDQISEIRDTSLEDQLLGLLVSKIQANELKNIWMAVPELVEWDQVRGFRFISRRRTLEFRDINLARFLDAIGGSAQLSIEALMRYRVRCLKHDGERLREWHVYKCLYAELEHDGETFVLSGARWYRVKSDFVRETDAAYNRIPTYDGSLPEYADDSEEEYAARVATLEPKRFALMDQKIIFHGGGHGQIEFCDLFTKDLDMFHVKQYGQSSTLSHLFAQGMVSGELFQMDREFRRKVNEKLPPSHRLSDVAERPKQDKFRVVFAIISDHSGALRLPFFSRLNLKNAARRLQAYGFRVAKAKVEVDERFSKTGRLQPKSRKRIAGPAAMRSPVPGTRIGA